MKIEKLSLDNVKDYLEYLKKALNDEPDMMTIDEINEIGIINQLNNQENHLSTSLLAFENNQVVGRIEYHTYCCIQGGYKMAYVNWVYVLKEYRHVGIAQALFRKFEEECKKNNVNQYFLIQAQNENAAKFYAAFSEATTTTEKILRKTLQ